MEGEEGFFFSAKAGGIFSLQRQEGK